MYKAPQDFVSRPPKENRLRPGTPLDQPLSLRRPHGAASRIDAPRDRASLWRPAFVRDVEKIMNVPAYNRLAGKTQVFSFRQNDDIYSAWIPRPVGRPGCT